MDALNAFENSRPLRICIVTENFLPNIDGVTVSTLAMGCTSLVLIGLSAAHTCQATDLSEGTWTRSDGARPGERHVSTRTTEASEIHRSSSPFYGAGLTTKVSVVDFTRMLRHLLTSKRPPPPQVTKSWGRRGSPCTSIRDLVSTSFDLGSSARWSSGSRT